MRTKPIKKPSIAAAEKRIIKAEISTLKKAIRKMDSDFSKFIKSTTRARKELDRKQARATTSLARETSAAKRRIGILEGRL